MQHLQLTAEHFQKNLQQVLAKIVSIKEVSTIEKRLVQMPKEYEETVIQALFKIFRRECWLLKPSEQNGFTLLEVDLRQAAVQFYYNKFENVINSHMQEVLRLSNQQIKVASDNVNDDSDFDFTMRLGGETPQIISDTVDITVNTQAPEQMIAWDQLVYENKFKKDEQYITRKENEYMIYTVSVSSIKKVEVVEDNISRIKKFFDGDYNISELDRGGMGAILKIITKHDPTILSLRPENVWARQRFAKYLQVRQDRYGRESVFAKIPANFEFVVKVAFEGHEEALIQEAALLTRLAEDPEICQTIIGVVQHGRVFAVDGGDDKKCLGYYMMLEYASEGNTEQLYRNFPDGRLTPTVAFAMMYGMVRTLQKLKKKGIIHRDIKPLNVLLGENGIPKLSDFGLSLTTETESGQLTDERRRLLRIVDQDFLRLSREREQAELQLERLMEKIKVQRDESVIQQIKKLQFRIPTLISKEEARADKLRTKYCPISAEENAARNKFEGSIYYAAPEQFEPTNVLTPKCDVYQLGAVMFTMLTGMRPITGTSLDELVDAAMTPEKPRVNDFIKGEPLVDDLSDLIAEMLQFEEENRIDIDEVRERMDRILFSQVMELKKEPKYILPDDYTPEEVAWWHSAVAFAKKLHSGCMETIFDSILHG